METKSSSVIGLFFFRVVMSLSWKREENLEPLGVSSTNILKIFVIHDAIPSS